MPFHLLDKYARDDAIVKAVFDHVRNIGIAAVVLGAAAWKQKHIGEGWVAVWDHFVAFLLGMLGISLTWLTQENLFSKIRNRRYSKYVQVVLILTYSVVFFELLKYIQNGKA